MRKISSIFLGIVFMISMVLSPVLSVSTKGAINEFQHRKYETREELETLKGLLEQNGYIHLTKDVNGYDKLKADVSFWHRGVMDEYNGKYYTIYILKTDLDEYLKGEDEDAIYYLNQNAVVISTYTLDVEDDETDNWGPTGSEIPEDWAKCLLTVRAECTEDYKNDILIGFMDDRGLRYEFLLQKGNGYQIVKSIPAGDYEVSYIMSNDKSSVKYSYDKQSNEWDCFAWNDNTNPIFTVYVGDKSKGGVASGTKQNQNVNAPEGNINKDNGGGQIDSTDNNQLVPVTPEQAKKDSVLLLIIELLGIIIIIITCILFVRHLKKKAGRRNDSF